MSLFGALTQLLRWPVVMGWHLWHILTLRPFFAGIPDNRKAGAAFFGVYLAAAYLRWILVEDVSLASAVVLINAFMIVLFFERRRRSSSLVFSMIGASASWDLIAAAVAYAGFPSTGGTAAAWAFRALELSTYYMYWRQFQIEPAAIQASGYMRNGNSAEESIEECP